MTQTLFQQFFRGRIICVFNLYGVTNRCVLMTQTLFQQAFKGELYAFINLYGAYKQVCADETNIASTGLRGKILCVIYLNVFFYRGVFMRQTLRQQVNEEQKSKPTPNMLYYHYRT